MMHMKGKIDVQRSATETTGGVRAIPADGMETEGMMAEGIQAGEIKAKDMKGDKVGATITKKNGRRSSHEEEISIGKTVNFGRMIDIREANPEKTTTKTPTTSPTIGKTIETSLPATVSSVKNAGPLTIRGLTLKTDRITTKVEINPTATGENPKISATIILRESSKRQERPSRTQRYTRTGTTSHKSPSGDPKEMMRVSLPRRRPPELSRSSQSGGEGIFVVDYAYR